MVATKTRQVPFSAALSRALRWIDDDQLSTGEIPNFRKLENGIWEYYFSPLVSAYVADALAIFDPTSFQFDPFLVEQTAGRQRFEVSRLAARVRRRIRGFVAWQQSADRTWRFPGRGSSLPPDIDTTACCALALLDRIQVNREVAARQLDLPLLQRHGSAALSSRGCTPDRVSSQDGTVDRVANINLFRFTVLAGGDAQPLASELLRQCGTPADSCSPNVFVFYVLGLAWRQSGLPGFENLKSAYSDALLATQTSEGSFGGALRTAMGLSALLDFGYAGPAIISAARWLRAQTNSSAALAEEFCDDLCSSPAFTIAVAINALSKASLCSNGAAN